MKRVKFHLTKRFKPKAVHAEALFIDDVWEIAKTKLENKEYDKWYLMTPANYDYFKGTFNTSLPLMVIDATLRVRYSLLKCLINNDNKIGLHIHLSAAMNLTYAEQKDLISKSIKWFKETLGFVPKEVVFGWWLYNHDTKEICKSYDLKIINQEDYNSIHDYNWLGIIEDDE